jgi:DNA-binding SARP family transcriptional activator
MQVRALGHLEIKDADQVISIPQRKVRQLITVLALAEQPIPARRLQSLLWEMTDRRDMLSALTTTVRKARQLLPDGRLIRDNAGYRLVLDGLDLWEFRDLTARARAVRENDPSKAIEHYQTAIGLWGGRPLVDLPDTSGIAGHAHQLLIARRDAIEALVEAKLAVGRHDEVARELPPVLAEDPLNEHLWVPYLLALYRDGRKEEAIQAYRDALTEIISETGAQPGLLLENMHKRIAANDPGLAWKPEIPVEEARATSAGIDLKVPSSARIYDHLLGGKDNYEVDRKAAEDLKKIFPHAVAQAVSNRRFLNAAVQVAAEAGIQQFIDLGTGIPMSPNVHEIARSVHPKARVGGLKR